MFLDARAIASQLTDPQRHCILLLTDDWQDQGYNKVYVNMLFILGDSDLDPAMPKIIERQETTSPSGHIRYVHRLSPIGTEVKTLLQSEWADA